jgi:hypothetical protein
MIKNMYIKTIELKNISAIDYININFENHSNIILK